CAATAPKPGIKIDGGEVRPSPASLCSAAMAQWRCATRPAQSRLRREGAMRARGDRARSAGWVRALACAALILLVAAPASADDFAALVGDLAGDSFAEK